MTLNANNVVQVGRGGAGTSSTSTAIAVTLDSGGTTAADSVVFVGLFGESLAFATPSGWALVGTAGSGMSVYRRGPVEGLAAGESSWNFTPSATAGKAVVAGAVELTGIDPNTTVDIAGTPTQATSGNTVGPQAGPVSTYDGLALGFLAHRDSANATPVTFDTYTGSVNTGSGPVSQSTEEVFEQGQAGTGNSVALAVGVTSAQRIGTYIVSAQPSRTPLSGTAPGVGLAIVINATGARKAIDLFRIDGNEHGTVTGNTLGVAPYRPWATLSAGVTISGAAARSGSFGMAFDSTSAVCTAFSDPIGSTSTGLYPTWKRFFNLRGDTTARRLWRVSMTTSTSGGISYVVALDATGKLSCTVSTGTAVLSDQTVPTSGWFGVELRTDCRGHVASVSSTYYADWSVDYDASLTDNVSAVAQTQANFTGTVTGSLQTFTEVVGWNTALTTAMYSDDGGAAVGPNYPLGDLRVLPLKVDPAGTITVTTSTNFGVMTANGTVAAWNATNARNAIDDVPPDLSGTRDALVALLASTTDHAKIPLETRSLAANKEAVRGFKWVLCMWAASTTASTCRVLIYEGTTSRTVYAEADPNADNTATPVWLSGVLRDTATPIIWTQPIVDALEVWFGSNDGNPDIGPDMVLGELAVVKAQTETLFGASPDLYVEAARDPDTQALVGMTVNTPAGQSATVDYEIDGTPGSTGSIAGGSSQYVSLSADGGIETVNKIQLTPG